MKQLVTLSLIIFLATILSAQEPNFYSTEQLIEPQYFALKKLHNFSGRNETKLTFKAPPNTESIIYKFSTSTVQVSSKNTNLFVELSKLVSGGMFTGVVKSLTQPSGVNACDVDLYEYGHKVYGASRENFSAGIVEYRPISKNGGFYSISIKNVTSNQGINAVVEVVAIIKDVEAEKKYNLKKTTDELGETIKDLAEVIQKNKAEKEDKHLGEMQTYLKLGYKKINKGDNEGAIAIFTELTKQKNKFSFVGYNGMASAYRNDGNFTQSIENHNRCIKEAKKKKSIKGQCYANMGLTYLVMGDELNANKCYLEFMKNCKTKDIRQAMAKELENENERLGGIEGASDILELLKE